MFERSQKGKVGNMKLNSYLMPRFVDWGKAYPILVFVYQISHPKAEPTLYHLANELITISLTLYTR